MRVLGFVIIIVLAVAAVLTVSATNLDKERRRLLSDMEAAAADAGTEAAKQLAERLGALERDMRLLVGLVDGSASQKGGATETESRVIGTAFAALAIVVPSYKTVVLCRPDGTPIVEGVDPTEDRKSISDVLLAASRARVSEMLLSPTLLDGPLDIGARSFYLYGARVRNGEAILLTVDAALFLGAAVPLRLPDSTVFIADPRGKLWLGCHHEASCRAAESPDLLRELPGIRQRTGRGSAQVAPTRWIAPDFAARLGLPRSAALLTSTEVASTKGAWRLWHAASARSVLEREDALRERLILTSLAAALAVAGVGLFILRQQRKAGALEERIRHVEEKANLERHLVRAEKLITVGALSAGIAHEIGTPLAVIRGRAESLARKNAETPKWAEDAHTIVRHIDGITSLIARVLDFSRTTNIELTAVRLDEAIAKTRELVGWKLKATDLALEVDVPPDLPPLSADGDQLVQVLVNLLTNACDASPKGSIRLSARTVATAHGGKTSRVLLQCRDEGCGIPRENINAVFDPFFTTKKRGEGAGLGLSTVASIVRNHGGEIHLESAVDRGTTVSISWPTC